MQGIAPGELVAQGFVAFGLLERNRSIAGRPSIAPLTNPSIVRSPLVIGMLEPMARAMGWPNKEIGLSDVFDLAGASAGLGCGTCPRGIKAIRTLHPRRRK